MTRMSSKGQIVIPQDMRADFQVGAKIFIIKNNNQVILKSEKSLEENFVEDLEFAQKTEAAMKRIENGEGIKVDFDDFIEEMKKW